jgi:UDP-3-O-[3-hydroxymyristoyl] N-acetylglucosamine deacetylase / 3-hydroxyacyl-[acyl-carrier-protein] dehydratase
MLKEKQRTIQGIVSVEGFGLHTGQKVNVIFKPARADEGICFARTDLPEKPMIRANFDHVLTKAALPRCTSIGNDQVAIHTVEHLMAALYGLKIDNLTIEINGAELPGLDGSGVEFYNVLKKIGVVEQDQDREYLDIKEPIWLKEGNATLFAVPCEDLIVSYTLDYNHPVLSSQSFSRKIDPEIFEKEIVSSRTFCLDAEAKKLQDHGLGRGANYQNTLVVTDTGVKENTLRFQDEFVRHKVLDFIGDLYLLGKPVRGHIVGMRSGHTLNRKLLQKILEQNSTKKDALMSSSATYVDGQKLDIQEIKKILPHRYPFLFVDRVVELEPGRRAVAIKNVTSNEPFFSGHFPEKPIMPGVIMVEAMAQVGGILVLTSPENRDKLALFMAIDKVKFRKVVEPGDQLIFEVTLVRCKTRFAQVHGVAKVNGKIVVEAELSFSFTERSYLEN